MEPILFIHIPKTAGTSLQESAVDAFGIQSVEKDYGPDKNYSTALVKEHLYGSDTNDIYGFKSAFLTQRKKWLGGHFHADKFTHLFGAQNTVSFVRRPVDRVISEYRYLQRTHGLDRSFEDFYRSPAETNKHFRMLGPTPWRALHLVGSLERYSECLKLLSSSFKLNLPEYKKNTNPIPQGNTVSADVRAEIAKWNERDILFVQEARDYLEKRIQNDKKGKPFCYHDSGFSLDEHIIGWAFYSGSNEVVRIGLYVNGQLKNEIGALEHRPDLQILQTPRGGHNGYRFVLSGYTHASHIEVRALNTEQTLFSWTRP
ncbi:MAG: sulfotransferase family 2 domain-containing protein [Kordiimonadaceae bacterium]|nr:sulfotransferase family 2 domain-containing protein [Kordiimonadaceae bacterium]